jgi:hypothetical protein
MRAGKHSKFPRKTLADAFDNYAEKVSPRKSKPDWERKRLDFYKREFADLPEFGDITTLPFHEIDTPHMCAVRDKRLKVVGTTAKRETVAPGVTKLASGKYWAQARVQGHPPQSDTFLTIKAAKEWREKDAVHSGLCSGLL